MLVAQAATRGDKLKLYEFPIAPLALEDDAVLRTLAAPKPVDRFHLVLGDALRTPFPDWSFDTVVTPWLIDIISEDLPLLAARIKQTARRQRPLGEFRLARICQPRARTPNSPEETKAIVAESGFSYLYVSQKTIP